MCLNQVLAKKKKKVKKSGQGWFKHMIYLPIPFCRKMHFCPEVYDLAFLLLKKEIDHTLGPLDGLNP